MDTTADLPTVIRRAYPALTTAPDVVATYRPDIGWIDLPPFTARDQMLANLNRSRPLRLSRAISRTYARSLARDGVTGVALAVGPGRQADFTIRELIHS